MLNNDHDNKPMPTKGIILVATGAPFYGRMAYNLAVSIKAVENIPVTVLHNGTGLQHLSGKQLSIFDTIVRIEPTSFAAKLCLADYSPYDCTLYFDADMLWMPKRKPSDLFKELEGISFTSITEGFYDYGTNMDYGNKMYHYWADPLEAQRVYGLTGKFYQWRSEVIYFEKSAAELFKLAKEIYADPKVVVKHFAGHIPDELAINIAASILNIDPHEYKWIPAYWHRLHGEGRNLPAIMDKYYLLSVGGNFASTTMKTCYNNICKAAHNKLGLQYLFTLQSKKSVMPDRIKM